MGILLPYNTADTHTYEELQAITNLNKDSLDGALGVIVKAGVLLIEPRNQTPGQSPGQKFHLNLDYKSKKLRVNLNQGIKTEQKQESDETHKTIEEDRRMLIQVSQHLHSFKALSWHYLSFYYDISFPYDLSLRLWPTIWNCADQ